MAAPVVAGNGAMARQYFREGWYNGARNLTQGFEPSAALLKAVLINSATALSFLSVDPETSTLDVRLANPPNIYQVRAWTSRWLECPAWEGHTAAVFLSVGAAKVESVWVLFRASRSDQTGWRGVSTSAPALAHGPIGM